MAGPARLSVCRSAAILHQTVGRLAGVGLVFDRACLSPQRRVIFAWQRLNTDATPQPEPKRAPIRLRLSPRPVWPSVRERGAPITAVETSSRLRILDLIPQDRANLTQRQVRKSVERARLPRGTRSRGCTTSQSSPAFGPGAASRSTVRAAQAIVQRAARESGIDQGEG